MNAKTVKHANIKKDATLEEINLPAKMTHKPLVYKATEAFLKTLGDRDEKPLKEKVATFFNETSFTPLVRIYNASNWLKRMLWLLVVLAMLTWLSVQCFWLFKRYFSYPVEVKMDLVLATELEFPSVTVCNLNPLRTMMKKERPFIELLPYLDVEYKDILYKQYQSSYDDQMEHTTPLPPLTTTSTEDVTVNVSTETSTESHKAKKRKKRDVDWSSVQANSSYNKWEMLEQANMSSEYYNERDVDYKAAQAYASFSRRHPEREVMSGGHCLKDFVVTCKMAGWMCSPRNFTSFLNHKYGNCYTFNGPDNARDIRTQFPGPFYGLSLEMYIEQSQYIGSLSPAAGVRVLIHPRYSMPFPEDQGISIPPGFETSIGIRKVDITRLPAPHGTCTFNGTDTDVYMKYKNTTYSKLSCMKSCYQRLSILYCGCAVPFFYVTVNETVCNMTDTKTEYCIRHLPERLPEEFSQCEVKCPLPCSEVKYEKSLSAAEWPSEPYQAKLYNRMIQTSYKFSTQNLSLWKEFVKLDVYYEDLMYQKIEQREAYESPNLISDVGGQLGLWLGLSAITIGELFSFMLSITKAVLVNRKRKTPVKPMDQLDLTKNITS